MEYLEYPKYFCVATNIFAYLRQKSRFNMKLCSLEKISFRFFLGIILFLLLKQTHVLINQHIFSFFDIFDN